MDTYGHLHIDLISESSIMEEAIGDDGHLCYRGDETANPEIEIDFINCTIRQLSSFRRSGRNGEAKVVQNEAQIECRPPKDLLKGNKWKLKANVSLFARKSLVFEDSYVFDHKNSEYITSLDQLSGNSGTIHVKFVQAFGLCAAPLLDFCSETKLRDTIVIVETKTYYFLASISPVFSAAFFGDLSHSTDHLILEDINPIEFEQFLQALHGAATVSRHNVEIILALADRFCVEWLRAKCSDVLIRTSPKDHAHFYYRLQLADKWNLGKLQAHLLERMDKAKLSALNEDKIKRLRPDTCQQLLKLAVQQLSHKEIK